MKNVSESNNSRRAFLGKMGLALLGTLPFASAQARAATTQLTILHTNDTHSRIDPFPATDPNYGGMGGVARRAAIIRQVRQQQQHVLLLDSGDIYQGTPYFNVFGGSLEFQMMSMMQYDAATMGNHDFDIGLEGFHRNLPHAQFPFLTANYDFSNTLLAGKTKPYHIFKKGPLRIGVFGLGIELNGLVNAPLYGETRYLNPFEVATDMARRLRHDHHCHLVICLSHLGYQYKDTQKPSDVRLAQEVSNIDIILGGHTHTFLDAPVAYLNPSGHTVLVAQTGYGGVRLGRIDVLFDADGKAIQHTAAVQPVQAP